MTGYRLDPIPTTLSDPRWQRGSTVHEAIFVGAATPEEARALAATRTANPTAPSGLQSPWLDDKLKSCLWERPEPEVPQQSLRLTVAKSTANSNGAAAAANFRIGVLGDRTERG
jgi:hypothetical protein